MMFGVGDEGMIPVMMFHFAGDLHTHLFGVLGDLFLWQVKEKSRYCIVYLREHLKGNLITHIYFQLLPLRDT